MNVHCVGGARQTFDAATWRKWCRGELFVTGAASRKGYWAIKVWNKSCFFSTATFWLNNIPPRIRHSDPYLNLVPFPNEMVFVVTINAGKHHRWPNMRPFPPSKGNTSVALFNDFTSVLLKSGDKICIKRRFSIFSRYTGYRILWLPWDKAKKYSARAQDGQQEMERN